jgi:outer membrane lipoprotein-sorting protein
MGERRMTVSKALVTLGACAAVAFPLAARADDSKAFLADTRRFPSLRSFRLQLDTQSPASGETAETLTYMAPDELRVEMPARNFTAVIVGSFVWLRSGGRTAHWKKVPMAPGADPLAAVHDTNAIAERVRGRTITFVGTEPLDGSPMHVYEIDAPPRTGYSAKTERIWIGARDGYPYKIVQRNGKYASTAVYSKFNERFAVSLEQ